MTHFHAHFRMVSFTKLQFLAFFNFCEFMFEIQTDFFLNIVNVSVQIQNSKFKLTNIFGIKILFMKLNIDYQEAITNIALISKCKVYKYNSSLNAPRIHIVLIIIINV